MERTSLGWIAFLLGEFGPSFLNGTILTLQITALGTLLGFLLGFLVGIIRSIPVGREYPLVRKYSIHGIKGLCAAFVEVFRGTPMMVQAMVVYYGLVAGGLDISPFNAAILVTLLNTGAYMAETVRGGIAALDPGQLEGGKAMGMNHFQVMFSVIMPQVFRNIIPEMGNLFITNLKMTSVLNVIGIGELFFVAKTTANIYYKYFQSFLIIGMIYFVLCLFFSRLLRLLEKRLDGKSNYELATEYMQG
jgi:putative lysine transport system permease protein